jgi:NADH-quinone oxidoreductase subunit B
MRSYRLADADGADLRIEVMDLGMACCAMEFVAAVSAGMLVPLAPLEAAAQTRHRVLVVSGTVTDILAPHVRQAWADDPCPVLSFGACSATGGPYWDSYSVTKGIDQLVPVRTYVPGCPPRPEALVAALRGLAVEVVP